MQKTDNNVAHVAKVRHSLAHLLAIEVLKFDPKAKLAIGPVIDNGFYYDFEFSEGKAPTEKDLKDFQKGMKKLIGGKLPFTYAEVTADEAKNMFADQPYKMELIADLIKDGATLSVYKTGDKFTDLCAGPHVENTSEIDADGFELTKIAGAYWRGSEKNKMLTRIYGVAFETGAELDAFKKQQEEAIRRDHRKLGKELKLFTISELVGAGLPLMQPNGMFIKKTLEDYLWDLHKDLGYSRVWTPHITKEALYEVSGHATKFGDELFRVNGKEEKFIMKPMSCPHHMQIFADNQFSYKDMPVRYFEPATVYRDEKSGQLGGLTRVRSITQDDGHLFCRDSQIGTEIASIVGIIKKFYTRMGMMDGYWVRLSLRGEDKSKYLGSDEVWNTAEKALTDVCVAEKLPYKPAMDEAAFYGPKLDFMFKDAIGREWQLATIQCDFNLPERFKLEFTNEKGVKERPVVIHRAIAGSFERFMGVMIEHFAGNFPLWLAPVQVKVIPVRENHNEYALTVGAALKQAGLRVHIDTDDGNMGKKVREGKNDKVPYMIIVGDKDIEANKITVESRDRGQIGQMDVAALIDELIREVNLNK